MDNFQIRIVSEGRDHFDKALEMAFFKYSNATHYSLKSGNLTFYWNDPPESAEALPLPYRMVVKSASDFAWHWLESADYGTEPDHDGDDGKGFVITNGDCWGQIDGAWQSIVQIQPCWAMYGK